MSSHVFGAFLDHQSSLMTSPTRILPRDMITPGTPTEHELDQLQWGQKLNGPRPLSHHSLPQTPGELEYSQPPTPRQDHAAEALLMSANNPRINKWRLVGAGLIYTLMGLSDAATGALIPYLEKDYNIGYALVSLIFVANAVGFIIAAPFTQVIDKRIGRSKSYILINSLLIIAFTALICAPPFPVIVVAFLFLGLGVSMFLAMTNIFIVNLMNGTILLGFMHALYGLGGIISPILATTIVNSGGRWSYFYTINLGMAVLSLFICGWSYRGFEDDVSRSLLTALERTASIQASTTGDAGNLQLLKRAFRQRTTSFGAIFILFYQGAEVAISGWVISFLITYRGGDPALVGYTTSGFWGGVTVGRIFLTPVAARLGEKRSVIGLTAAVAAFQLLVWLIPNVIGNAVAESIVGLAIGPVYPCATAVFSKLLPRSLQITALSFITSMGSSGGALIPLVTGLMAQKLGVIVLHPIVLFSCAVMIGSWAMLPRIQKPRD